MSASEAGIAPTNTDRATEMNKMRSWLGLLAVPILCAWTASPATAAPEWLRNGAPITAASQVNLTTGTGRLLFEDTKGAGGQPIDVECPFTGKGTIGPVAAGKITEMNISLANCVSVSNCGVKPEEASVINLPWVTEVILVEVMTVDLYLMDFLEEAGKGAPGWLIKCGGFDDTCTNNSLTEPAFLELSNETVNMISLVDAAFHPAEQNSFFNCSLGGAKAGLNNGLFTIEDPGGASISVSG